MLIEINDDDEIVLDDKGKRVVWMCEPALLWLTHTHTHSVRA